MVGEIGAAITSLKTAFDIAKSINDLVKNAEVQAAVMGLQQKILEAQSSALSANERDDQLRRQIEALSAEVTSLKNWDAEKAKYDLLELDPGFYGFVLKDEERGQQPYFALCPNCFEANKKSILHQSPDLNVNLRTWSCAACNSSYGIRARNMKTLIERARGVSE
ncbi:hypothetical protein IFT84_17525 [Rhizobium sp. CFBP 8762]|uniref:hypothetical protein n=1 Tax=Rhizobium sp. CFBP 8762 TaxID=2775279 RepID=UPI00177AA667|nr:hypothetical protein [Rhizobium sp. CFBP 8762]MBD8556311.1 hypothetical protein [Rhizobium sp. CFBP 8762]